MFIRITQFICIYCFSLNVMGAGLIADAIKDIGIIDKQTTKALDDAQRDLKQATPAYKALEESTSKEIRRLFGGIDKNKRDVISRAIEDAQVKSEEKIKAATESIQQADAKLKEYNIKIKELGNLGEQIEREKDQLKVDKVEIERKSDLYSMGFYASLTTTVLAVFGFVFNIPTVRLERKLKLLEIEEKEIALSKVRNV